MVSSKHTSKGVSNGIIILIAVVAIIIVAGAVTGYYFFVKPHQGGMYGKGNRNGYGNGFRNDSMGNRTRMMPKLSEAQVEEVSAKFKSGASNEEIMQYCGEHRFECMYYCTMIDPTAEACSSLVPPRNWSRRGGMA